MDGIRIVHHYYRKLPPAASGYFRDVDTDDIFAVIETQYRRHSPWLILTSAASLVAILNSVVLGADLTGLGSALAGGFRGWNVAVGVAGAALWCWLALRFAAAALVAVAASSASAARSPARGARALPRVRAGPC